MPFVHRLRVRFHECDPQGVVFYAQYFAYVDVALTEMWREAMATAVRRDDELLVDGRIVHVFVDAATMGKKAIPDHMRAALEAYA